MSRGDGVTRRPIDGWVVRLALDGNRWTKRRQIETALTAAKFRLKTVYKAKSAADLDAAQASKITGLEFVVVECIV